MLTADLCFLHKLAFCKLKVGVFLMGFDEVNLEANVFPRNFKVTGR